MTKCCYGHGWWRIGDLVPIGPSDAQEWKGQTIKCPVCKAGDIKDMLRYPALCRHFNILKED